MTDKVNVFIPNESNCLVIADRVFKQGEIGVIRGLEPKKVQFDGWDYRNNVGIKLYCDISAGTIEIDETFAEQHSHCGPEFKEKRQRKFWQNGCGYATKNGLLDHVEVSGYRDSKHIKFTVYFNGEEPSVGIMIES